MNLSQPESACREKASSVVTSMLAEVSDLACEINELSRARLEPLRLPEPETNECIAKQEEEFPPYFANLRGGLQTIRSNLYAIRDNIRRCEI